MLCCVSRRAVVGRDQWPPHDHYSSEVDFVTSKLERIVENDQCVEPDVASILLPCAFCARTFMPESLEKHTKICQQAANKKRKPFDSAKQRIQGTELAGFQPRRERRHHSQDDRSSKSRSSWKQTHDDFLQAIRAARNEITESTMQKQCNSVPSSGPSRANEQGVCPTCNRHFGIKAYDRHVAWCKERITKMPVSPATNIAKERLEARMRYRAPSLKNRRLTTREKYSPGSATTLNAGNKTSPTINRAKESVSAPNCNKGSDSPVKLKSATARRLSQSKESSPLGRMKSRAIDRTNRPPEDSRPTPPERASQLPVPPLKYKRESLEECVTNRSPPKLPPRRIEEKRKQGQATGRVRQEDRRQVNSARSQKANIVSARSQGNPKVNDVSINVGTMGVIVKPCNIHQDELTTWERISQGKKHHYHDGKLEDFDAPSDLGYIEKFDSKVLLEDDALEFPEDGLKDDTGRQSSRSGSVVWPTSTSKLNQTFSFRDSTFDGQRKWKPVKNSPRIEFCFEDPEKIRAPGPLLGYASSVGFDARNSGKNCGNAKVNSAGRKRLKQELIEDKSVTRESKRKDKDLQTSSVEFLVERCESMENENLEKMKSEALKCSNLEKHPTTAQNSDDYRNVKHESRRENDETANLDDGVSPVDCENLKLSSSFETFNCGSVPSRDGNVKIKDIDKELRTTTKHELQYLTSSEQYPEKLNDFSDEINVTVNEMREEEVNQQILSNDNKKPGKIKAIENVIDENFDFASDRQSRVESFQDEVTGPIESEVTCNIETESDAFLTLRPSGSSTPFDKIEDHLPCHDYEVPKEKAGFPPTSCDWEVSIDADRGAEVLYRVEPNVSNRPNSIQNQDELQKANFAYKNSKSGNSSSNRYSESGEGIDMIPTAMPATIRKEQRKDIANQMGECNCSLTIPSGFANETMANENITEIPEREEKICDDCLKNKSSRKYNETETPNLEKINPVFDQTECVKIKHSSYLKETECNYNQCNLNTSDNTKRLNSTSNIFIEPSGPTEDEEIQEIYKNNTTRDFDDDSDIFDEQIAQEDFRLPPPTSEKFAIKNLRSILRSESRIEMKKTLSRTMALRSRRSSTLGMNNRTQDGTNVFNDSSDSFGSSVDAVDFTDVKQVESVEVETIEEIGTRNRSIRFKILPEIKNTSTVMVKKQCNEEERCTAQTYWEQAKKAAGNRLINLDPPRQGACRFLKKNPKVCVLPPVPSNASLIRCSGNDYDPFLLAEQQMNDLLSDASEQSATDGPVPIDQNCETAFPLSHSSAFVKYSYSNPDKRSPSLAPHSEFEDLASDFSSDSTETNSLAREVFLKQSKEPPKSDTEKKSPNKELGRRVIIDKSKALGGDVEDPNRGSRGFASTEKARKIFDKVSPKVVRSSINRSFSVRASSAPKATPDRKTVGNDSKKLQKNESQRSSNATLNKRNNNYVNLSTSNISLSSIVSSDADIKRSNSVFDELMTSLEDQNGPFPFLKSLIKNDSLSSPVHGRQRGDQVSDEELSSPESYKRQIHGKFSGDSAYSSLNRKYSNHGRSTTDVAGRLDEDQLRNRRNSDSIASAKYKMSKFCHECGSKFPETAKFCCECGIRRLVF